MALTEVNSLGIKNLEVKEADIANDAVSLAKMAGLARGKLIVGDSSGNPSALAAGSDNHVLTMDSNGDCGWEAAAAGGATINNATENELVTVASTTTQLDAESTLTYDGAGQLAITGNSSGDGLSITNDGDHYTRITMDADRSSASNALGILQGKWNNNAVCSIYLRSGADTSNKDDGEITFSTSAAGASEATRMTVENDGNVTIEDGNLVIGTAGHGIDFTASTDGSGTVESEVLADYEEGTWTPGYEAGTTAGTVTYGTYRQGDYVRVGNLVHLAGYITMNSWSGFDGQWYITGLPFSAEMSPDANWSVGYAHNFANLPDDTILTLINGHSVKIRLMHYTTGGSNMSNLGAASQNCGLVFSGTMKI